MNKLTHEQFDKMWEDSTKEEVLFQFYYDYYKKVEALDRIDKAIEYINKYKNQNWYIESRFTEELLNILNGSDKE